MFSLNTVKYLLSGIFILLATLSPLSFAVEERERFGVLDYIDHSESSLIINDSSVKMGLNFKVYDLRGREVNRYSLKVGQNLVYTVVPGSSGSKNITKAWIKPTGYEY